jgi:hypothetical protein
MIPTGEIITDRERYQLSKILMYIKLHEGRFFKLVKARVGYKVYKAWKARVGYKVYKEATKAKKEALKAKETMKAKAKMEAMKDKKENLFDSPPMPQPRSVMMTPSSPAINDLQQQVNKLHEYVYDCILLLWKRVERLEQERTTPGIPMTPTAINDDRMGLQRQLNDHVYECISALWKRIEKLEQERRTP